ncbi:hypothetical protein SAMN05660337_2323 [Maridesulfovibrio ferrireducens]|uniref:Carbohydrate binding domain-containing protein n=1 Tax=Maridesulfovibrio ferrireducens TaxID=246191 RepID=A0A1G9HV64_9BACT|nr:hypothetical protein [Maridesulfovibrio ferrireducens]SDL16752.1 hypothetical protein SAMN05660337_2323 [Maridesulfovibrio ferrireducens]
MNKILYLFAISTFSLLLCASSASAENCPFKSFSFEKKKASSDWSAKKTYVVSGNRTLGLFNNRNKRYPSQTVLTIKDIPKNSSITVKFDMLYIGSWDSEGKLADRFTITVGGGPEIMNITKFPCLLEDGDDTKPVNNTGFVKVGERDRAYWVTPLSFTVEPSVITNSELKLEFKGYLTGRKTEFWALDNVEIFIN